MSVAVTTLARVDAERLQRGPPWHPEGKGFPSFTTITGVAHEARSFTKEHENLFSWEA